MNEMKPRKKNDLEDLEVELKQVHMWNPNEARQENWIPRKTMQENEHQEI